MRALWMALAAALLFGAATPASKILLGDASPFQIAGLMGLGSMLVTAPFVLNSRQRSTALRPWKLEKGSKIRLALSLILGGTMGPVFLLMGLNVARASSVSMWLNLELVLTAVVATLFFGERIGRQGWLAVAIAVVGAALLSFGEGAAGVTAGLFVALACLCWAVDNNATATVTGISPAAMTFWKGTVSGIVNTSIGLALVGVVSLPVLMAGLVIGALCFGTSIVLYIHSAQRLGATRAQVIFASAPFWGLTMSAFLLEGAITALQWMSPVLFAASVALLFMRADRDVRPCK